MRANADQIPGDIRVAVVAKEEKTVVAAEVAAPADKTIAGAPDEVSVKTLNMPNVILSSNSNP